MLNPKPLPKTIGKYHVLRELGRGGMGVVYLAEDAKLARQVAIKMMLARSARNENARARFLSEARAMAKIKSDHVVTVYEVDEHDGQPYFAMEVLEGLSLDELLESPERLPLSTLLGLCADFAEGVADAHGQGIIHRDLKPANLFVETPRNRGKVLDFGLTRLGGGQVTQEGKVMGTVSYMPLEQAKGEKVDHRADIYSLGVVFYELCTGTLPFDAEGVDLMVVVQTTTEPARVETLNRAVPPAFADLIHRMLHRRPEQRPPTVRHVCEELTAIRDRLRPPSDSDRREAELARREAELEAKRRAFEEQERKSRTPAKPAETPTQSKPTRPPDADRTDDEPRRTPVAKVLSVGSTILKLQCPSCAVPVMTRHESVGKKASCPKCQVEFRVPPLPQLEAEDAEPSKPKKLSKAAAAAVDDEEEEEERPKPESRSTRAGSFKQQCPSCETMVPIKDRKLIGKKVECPKCKYRFLVEAPVDDDDDDDGELPIRRSKKKAKRNSTLLVGMVLGVVALVCLGWAFFMLFSR
jgi:serine/threonine protein kinase